MAQPTFFDFSSPFKILETLFCNQQKVIILFKKKKLEHYIDKKWGHAHFNGLMEHFSVLEWFL